MIKYFEAFAGIGAFRSAFEKVGGFECVGWCEIDRFAQKAYRTLYDTKGEIFYEDITKIDYGNMPDFDLLVGGPCCQSFSVAGRRLAFEGDRGNLFFNYIQILEAKRPRYFIAENVSNLLGISQGECFRIILEKISELGYSMCWRVLNSAGFGIPQSRRRLFLIGYLGDKCPSEILAFGGNDEENCEKRKPEQLIGGSQGSGVLEEAPRAIINPFKETTRQNGRRIKEPNEPMFTLTVTDRHGIVHKGRIRRLMPVECWRLQGFTTEQFEKVATAGMSDAQIYKQAGNSITVNVVEAIARNLLKFDEEENANGTGN